MAVPKVNQQKLTETINAVQWTAHGDDAEAAMERESGRGCAGLIASRCCITW
jgi:hypothetical protein